MSDSIMLGLAVAKGDLRNVKDILKNCPDIDSKRGRDCLKFAVHGNPYRYKEIVEALLEYGLTVNPEDANDPKLLHAAVEKGYLKIVEDLLKYGANVNALHDSSYKIGFTPLHVAARYKQEEVAKLLISYDADVNSQDETRKTPIFYAIRNSDSKITKLLLTNRADINDGFEPFYMAVRTGCIEIVEALLQHGIDVNACDKYQRYSTTLSESEDFYRILTEKHHDIDIVGEVARLLLNKKADVVAEIKNGVTPLHIAAARGYAESVAALLGYNANVNSKINGDITPLHISADQGNLAIMMMLLNKGANVNAKEKNGITALHTAAYKNHKNAVEGLLKCGAKVDPKMKNDMTPLLLAAKKGSSNVIEILLEMGVDIHSRDENGRTALHIASEEGHNAAVKILLDYGSDINIMSKNNCTALDHAIMGMGSFYNMPDNSNFDPSRGMLGKEQVAETLQRHILKMKAANLYISEENLFSMRSSARWIAFQYDWSPFPNECKKEIANMKNEKIDNHDITFYDILTKNTSSLAIYMGNENIVQVLKSNDYKKKFPIYASMIQYNSRAMEKKKLLELGHKSFHFFSKNLPELPYECTEKIISYLSDEDLRNLIDACEPLDISNSNTNIDDRRD